ncbi:MAG: OmpP1/FadL family transporter, partial [Thermodesulfobacteriota bacterium]
MDCSNKRGSGGIRSLLTWGGWQQWMFIGVMNLLLLFPAVSWASGFRITTQGAKATAMGNAFVATADAPSAIAYNPAGLIRSKGTNIYLGPTMVIPSTTYKSPSGESEDTNYQVFYPPHLYISSDLEMENVTFGIGIFAPFGLGTKWS